jgi:4-aminobutyrate aminotransferase-like enzyme
VSRLRRGDRLPSILCPPPGPHSRRLARHSTRLEAPGINAVGPDGTTLVWQEAKGANVLDVDGNRYVDLTAGFGVAAVGHRHPAVVAAIRQQSGRLIHGLGDVHSHLGRSELAREILKQTPVDTAQVFFGVSGSDAVEIAVKTAMLATGRPGVLAFEPAYHGLSLGALNLTSRSEFREPFAAHLHANVHRLSFGCPSTEIAAWLRRHPETSCIVVEPAVGREGILLPPSGWLGELRRLCSRHQVLMIADEIFTGFGRTGRWFAVDHESVRPDLLCCGKALSGGLPMAAVVGRRDLLAVWKQEGEALHTGTFVAHPLSCAAALATLRVIRSERLVQRSARLGRQVAVRLCDWPESYPAVLAVRGRGLMWGVELANSATAHRLARALLERGVLALAGGPDGSVLQLVPPLVISESQLFGALDIIASSLKEI